MRSKTLTTRCALMPALGVALLLVSSSASAHIELTDPPARYHRDFQKSPPCGHVDNPPGTEAPTVLAGGETIVVSIDEFIDHPSHFRIAIAPSDGEFVDPSDYDDFYSAANVVLDDIEDMPGVRFHDIELEVPDIDCDPCVMQVQQIMYSGAPFSQAALYYQCADIVIEASGAATGGNDDGTGGDADTSGGEASADDTGGPSDDDGTTGASDNDDDDDGTTSSATDGDETPTGAGDGGDEGCGCTATRDRPGTIALGLLLVAAGLRRRPR
jgi:uncharacterized protein (TIGR03382 family)